MRIRPDISDFRDLATPPLTASPRKPIRSEPTYFKCDSRASYFAARSASVSGSGRGAATPSSRRHARCIFQRRARLLGVGLLCYNVHDVFIQARYSENETPRRTRRIAGVRLVQTV